MTAPTRDVHGAALDRTRKRAARTAWNQAVAEWRETGEQPGNPESPIDGADLHWSLTTYQLYGATFAYDLTSPAFVAEGK